MAPGDTVLCSDKSPSIKLHDHLTFHNIEPQVKNLLSRTLKKAIIVTSN